MVCRRVRCPVSTSCAATGHRPCCYRDLRATAKRSLRVLLGQQSLKPNDIRPHDLMTGMMLYGSQQAGRALGLSGRSAPRNETGD